MADQPKKKNAKDITRNDSRPNGKANKTRPDGFFKRGTSYRGSHTRRTRLSDVQKVLQGQGAFRNGGRRADGTNPKPWTLPSKVTRPAFPENLAENRRLYPHLFADD